MITRIWHGWTKPDNADAYQALLLAEILPGIHRIDGYLGAYLLRQDGTEDVEFVTLTLWESLEALRAFAGEDYARAVVPPAARELLDRFDERSAHYHTVAEPPARPAAPGG
jgi:heme-degrading monooxygenase HmoA